MKIALVENYGADFVGARLRLAVFLKNKGVDVIAIVPKDGHKNIIQNSGIKVIEVGANIRAKGLKVKYEYAKHLKLILKEEKFDIVHFFRLQPNIIGTIVASLNTKSKIVNHITGLGVAFSGKDLKSKIQQFIIKSVYKFNYYFFKPHTIFQNKYDMKDLGFSKRSECIEGSAVNEDRFNVKHINDLDKELKAVQLELGDNKSIKFIFVSRLLKEKGVLELIAAFESISKRIEKPIKLIIVGWSDSQNPSAVLPKDLEKLIKNKPNIQYLGKRTDVEKLLHCCDIGILPTYYREGTPRFLLESMRMKKPIITTNMPGCDHLIDENGILIEPKSIKSIEEGILKILDKNLTVLGENSFHLYNSKFSEKVVYSAILKTYLSLLN